MPVKRSSDGERRVGRVEGAVKCAQLRAQVCLDQFNYC